MHFHWTKIEDIINRGGGNLVVELFGSIADEGLSDQPGTLLVDGLPRRVEPGGKVILTVHPAQAYFSPESYGIFIIRRRRIRYRASAGSETDGSAERARLGPSAYPPYGAALIVLSSPDKIRTRVLMDRLLPKVRLARMNQAGDLTIHLK